MSLVHLWWESEVALCGSTEVGHGEPCLGALDGQWPGASWDEVACRGCGVPLCRECMRISAKRHGKPLSKVALLRPRLVVSV